MHSRQGGTLLCRLLCCACWCCRPRDRGRVDGTDSEEVTCEAAGVHWKDGSLAGVECTRSAVSHERLLESICFGNFGPGAHCLYPCFQICLFVSTRFISRCEGFSGCIGTWNSAATVGDIGHYKPARASLKKNARVDILELIGLLGLQETHGLSDTDFCLQLKHPQQLFVLSQRPDRYKGGLCTLI